MTRLSYADKKAARKFARSFAAGLVESAEVHLQEGHGLTEEQLDEAHAELQRIASRIEARLNPGQSRKGN